MTTGTMLWAGKQLSDVVGAGQAQSAGRGEDLGFHRVAGHLVGALERGEQLGRLLVPAPVQQLAGRTERSFVGSGENRDCRQMAGQCGVPDADGIAGALRPTVLSPSLQAPTVR
jgi:hypothetical protein